MRSWLKSVHSSSQDSPPDIPADPTRLLSDKVTSLGSSGVVDGSIRAIGYTYDDMGRIASITSYSNTDMASNHIANEVSKSYDNWGNVASTRQSHEGAVTGSTPAVAYLYADGASGGDAKFVRLAKVTYPSGRQVHYLYGNTGDANDRLSRVYEVGGTSSFTDASFYARYTYQGAGTILSETQASGKSKLDITFDRFGRVSEQDWNSINGSTATQINTMGYTFDANSNRLTKTTLANEDARTALEAYSYDGLNRLSGFNSQVTVGSTTTNVASQNWTGLDALGNWRDFSEDTDGDAVNDLVQTRITNNANEIGTIGATTGSNWVDPIYDAAGNMISMPIPGNETASQEAVYDAWNRMVSVKQGTTVVATYEYDGLTRRIGETDASGNTQHVFFNDQWQVLEQFKNDRPLPSESNIWSLRYIDALITQDKVTHADDGSFDTSFSGDGRLTTDLGGNDNARSSAIQADGKLVVVGVTDGTTYTDGFVIRYTSDGLLDTTFSSDGKVFFDLTVGYDQLYDVKILSDGKILAVGCAGHDTVLIRLNTDGSLDSTFGDTTNTPGMKVFNLSGSATGAWQDTAQSVAIDSSGRIVIAGVQWVGSDKNVLVARINASGSSLDTSFGSSGTDIFDFGSTDEIANALAIDSSATILLAGNSGNEALLVRLTSSGTLDTSFDTDGRITFLPTSGTQAWFNDLAIDAAGRYVVGGTLQTSTNSEMLLMRVNTDASLDTSFDADGIVRDNAAYNSEAQSLVLQLDGRIVVGGRVDHDTLVVRFDSNGSRDMSFGTNGRQRIAIGAQFGIDIWTSVVSDGKNLYAVGVSDYNDPNVFDVAAMRLNTGVSFDQTLYFQQDANYNVMSVTNSGGEVLERYSYLPYGPRTAYTASHVVLPGTTYEQHYGFQGAEADHATYLMLFRNRYMHATLGSWARKDPAGYVDGENLYQSYAGQPINLTDAMGLDATSDIEDVFNDATVGIPYKFEVSGILSIQRAIVQEWLRSRDDLEQACPVCEDGSQARPDGIRERTDPLGNDWISEDLGVIPFNVTKARVVTILGWAVGGSTTVKYDVSLIRYTRYVLKWDEYLYTCPAGGNYYDRVGYQKIVTRNYRMERENKFDIRILYAGPRGIDITGAQTPWGGYDWN